VVYKAPDGAERDGDGRPGRTGTLARG
jgi:hypothetical protein